MDSEILNTRLLTYDIKVSKSIVGIVSKWCYKDKVTVGMIISNLQSCYSKNNKLVYSRDYNKKAVCKRKTNARKVIKAVDFLVEKGYVINLIGKGHRIKEKREVSYILPTPDFIRDFCSDYEALRVAELSYLEEFAYIELRDENKEVVNFRKDSKTRELERVVRELNKVLSFCTVRDKNGRELSNFYCRIFNESFERGGRYYRGDVLRINNKEDDRLKITINGNPVCEVDYANLHFRIAACVDNLDLTKVQDDVYYGVLDIHERTPINRGIVKLAINVMFNSASVQKARAAIQKEINSLKNEQYTLGNAGSVMQRVVNAYPMFKNHFCIANGYGSVLQNLDSELATMVIDSLLELGIPCLPVHDSFIVEQKYEQKLVEVMSDSFRGMFNVDLPTPLGVSLLNDGEIHKYNIIG